MAAVIWTAQALEDINAIAEYIAADSPKYAAITVQKFFSKAAMLETLPNSGRVVPELNNPSIRELLEGNYRIIYQITPQGQVQVLTVHHSARQLPPI
ncbi:type II toxin-antitoxin system RelE/ParE family toxin [Rufibacter sp. LB8]|uniref:type II toxin-antitoxin system RelE/ParE family toxin n=1 Tax=Rufibacter sp. LB8 TaxID=2777781 RepID=UPI00178C4783|nr:type II toxin-antitoxin system RelE/ParE family toxin [Rufibacter sp. LB8]